MTELIKCKHCEGTGGRSNVNKWVIGEYCRHCNGTGWIKVESDGSIQKNL